MTVVVQTEARRHSQAPARGQVPDKNGRYIMRSVPQPKAIPVAKPAIHLYTCNEILWAERAALCGGFQGQRAAGAERITEFPRLVVEIFCGDDVLCKVPPLERA